MGILWMVDGVFCRDPARSIPVPPPNSEVAAQPRALLEHRTGTEVQNWEPVTAIEKSAEVHERLDTLDSSTATVKDLMSRQVVAVSSNTRVSEALQLFQDADIQHLPVVNEEQALIGLVSDRDLMGREGEVGEFMASKVLTASPDTSLEQAAQALAKQRFHSLVVVDEKRTPVGMLTSSDMLNFLVSHPAMRLWRR